jgi:hypothetical protein
LDKVRQVATEIFGTDGGRGEDFFGVVGRPVTYRVYFIAGESPTLPSPTL